MAQTGYTPISIYYSATAAAAPTAGNLVAGELAINTNDGVLYYKDSSGVVQSIASKAGNSGSFTNLAYTGTLTGGTGVINLGSGQFYKDASGNVGIGTASPTGKTTINYNTNTAYNTGLSVYNANSGSSAVVAFQLTNDAANRAGAYLTSSTCAFYGGANTFNLGTVESIPFTFLTGNSERMRIDSSGRLLINATSSTTNEKLQVTNNDLCVSLVGQATTNIPTLRIQRSANDGDAVTFYYGATQKGYISVTSTGTTYNTLSDYRLKENVAPIIGALDTIVKLKPVTYTWKADGSDGQGFIAHELQEVVPDCVTGEKDAVNEDGSIKAQGIDTSFLVATLTAAIQEQQAMIEELKAKVAALEAA